MIFALILFGVGPILQIGGVDPNRFLRVRVKISFMWRGVARVVFERVCSPDMELYGA